MRRLTRVTALACAIFAASLGAEAGSRRLGFREYRDLSDEFKARLVRQYVRKKGGYWIVAVNTYLVHTDISPEKALSYAVLMDEFQRSFSKIFVGTFRLRTRPELYALKDKASYAEAFKAWMGGFKGPPEWSAGMFASVGDDKHALFGCAGFGERKLRETLFHEGTHQLLHYYVGSTIPIWFDEGCATNLQTWNVGRSPERNVYEEIWKSNYPCILYTMRTGKTKIKLFGGRELVLRPQAQKPDLEKLFGTTSGMWLMAEDPTPLYAQAWGFVNFLLTQGEVGQKYFNFLLVAFRRGKGTDMKRLMPARDRAQLVAVWNRYLDETIVPHCEYVIPIARAAGGGRAGEMVGVLKEGLGKYPKNPELLLYRALMIDGPKEAYTTLKSLEKRKPRHPLLYKALGRSAMEVKQLVSARKWLKMALAEDPADEEAKKLLEQVK